MSEETLHVLCLFIVAGFTGHYVEKGQYGSAVTFALIFFAMLVN